jgi:hypothetical protein
VIYVKTSIECGEHLVGSYWNTARIGFLNVLKIECGQIPNSGVAHMLALFNQTLRKRLLHDGAVYEPWKTEEGIEAVNHISSLNSESERITITQLE